MSPRPTLTACLVHWSPNDRNAESRIAGIYARALREATSPISAAPLLDSSGRQIGIRFMSPGPDATGLLFAGLAGAVAFGWAQRCECVPISR